MPGRPQQSGHPYRFELIAMPQTAITVSSGSTRLTMTTIVIACGAVLVVTALAVAVFLLGRGSRRSADERFAAVAEQIDDRMQAMVRDLSAALERAQDENRRNRRLGELGGTIDLDEVLTRTLQAAGALDGVDAAVVAVGDRGTSRSSPLSASPRAT